MSAICCDVSMTSRKQWIPMYRKGLGTRRDTLGFFRTECHTWMLTMLPCCVVCMIAALCWSIRSACNCCVCSWCKQIMSGITARSPMVGTSLWSEDQLWSHLTQDTIWAVTVHRPFEEESLPLDSSLLWFHSWSAHINYTHSNCMPFST